MRKSLVKGLMAGVLGMGIAVAEDAPTVSFSGYVDADFASEIKRSAIHTTGLEIDLTTTVTFNPRLNAVIYTTMTDGVVPAQGDGVWWPVVAFDGVTLNWEYTDGLTIMVGDLIAGTGYFDYYLHKRAAMVVGEHAVRGVGFETGGLLVHTGMSGPNSWGTFASYELALGEGLTLTPSALLNMGDGEVAINGGISFLGEFGDFALKADFGVNHWDDFDLGYSFLIEPSYSMGNFSLAAALFYSEKGDNPAPNIPATTLPIAGMNVPFDDFFVYVEPGISLNDTFAFGLPLEYHIEDRSNDDSHSIWVVPTLYIYPGANVEWWVWGQVVVPTTSAGGDPQFFAGSEIIFSF